jgi:hypothetical protein
VLSHLYDFVIIAPLSLEKLVRSRSRDSGDEHEARHGASVPSSVLDDDTGDTYLGAGPDSEPLKKAG